MVCFVPCKQYSTHTFCIKLAGSLLETRKNVDKVVNGLYIYKNNFARGVIMKKQTVIVLQGKGEMGKSTTLRKLIEILEKGNAEKIGKPEKERRKDDTWAVFDYNDRIIGITTSGDNEDELKPVIEYELPENCDIIVCAARTKGSSVDYINNHFKKDLIIWLGRFSATSDNKDFNMDELQKSTNEWQAEKIKDIIDNL